MAQKKIKKSKAESPKKAPKSIAKKVAAKKPAKPVAKKAGAGSVVKKNSLKKSALNAPAAKKVASKKTPKAAPQVKKAVLAPAPAAPKLKAKAQSIALKRADKAPPTPAAAKNGKKKPEVVLEVPAPKGVVILGKEGKKRGKSAEQLLAISKRRCREPGCEHEHLIGGYCRLHYIKNWRKIKRKEAILASGQLNNYVEELVSKYPDKYLEVIRQDLASEKDWAKVVIDLELESADEEAAGDEDMEGVTEGVRREREFDDDSDSF